MIVALYVLKPLLLNARRTAPIIASEAVLFLSLKDRRWTDKGSEGRLGKEEGRGGGGAIGAETHQQHNSC